MFANGAEAQPYTLASPVNRLATIFTDLYGPKGLIVDSLATLPGEQPHSAHFNSDFQFDFSQFSTALVNQFVSVPLPSPTSGFTYEFDPTLGVFQRTTRSFGPILADRADTIGARRVSIGFAFQRFTFDTVEGLDLLKVPAVFTHDNAALLGGREDVVTTMNAIEASVNQATTYVTVGDHRSASTSRWPCPIVSEQPEGRLHRHHSATGHDQPVDALLPSSRWRGRRGSHRSRHRGRPADWAT